MALDASSLNVFVVGQILCLSSFKTEEDWHLLSQRDSPDSRTRHAAHPPSSVPPRCFSAIGHKPHRGVIDLRGETIIVGSLGIGFQKMIRIF